MINKRIIPVVILKNGLVVQSYNFNHYLPIGKPEFIVEYLSSWDSDEIVILDIDATKENRHINVELISRLSKNVSVPLTVGGGITGLDIAELYFKNGADKVAINSLFLDGKYDEINAISMEYGSQSVVLSLDFIENFDSDYSLFDYRKGISTKRSAEIVINDIRDKVEVGEILVNSVNRDGSKRGYDVRLFTIITQLISKPVLAIGGADSLDHFIEIIGLNNVTGLCASNVFLHFEHSVEYFRSKINSKKEVLRANNYFLIQ